MKAAIYRQYGPPDIINIEDMEQPQAKDNEVLIKVHSASVNPYDCHHRKGFFPVRLMTGGLFRPKTNQLGVDVAGTVEKIGKDVKRLKVGDHVFGFVRGSCAEYVSADEKPLSIKPIHRISNTKILIGAYWVNKYTLDGSRRRLEVAPRSKSTSIVRLQV